MFIYCTKEKSYNRLSYHDLTVLLSNGMTVIKKIYTLIVGNVYVLFFLCNMYCRYNILNLNQSLNLKQNYKSQFLFYYIWNDSVLMAIVLGSIFEFIYGFLH